MANFSIISNIQVIPVEEITFTDTNQKVKGIHSNIDSTSGSSYELLIGTNANNVRKKTFNPDGDYNVPLGQILTLSNAQYVNFLFVKLTARGADTEALGPRMTFTINGQNFVIFFGKVGAFFCSPIWNINTDNILLRGGTSFTVTAFEIIAGLV
jgi:hypothetical protein